MAWQRRPGVRQWRVQPSKRSMSMRHFQLAEPLVMLATVAQWLLLSIFAGTLIGIGCSTFLHLLFTTSGHAYDAPLWTQMLLLPLAGLANGLLLHYGYRLSRSGYQDNAIVAVNAQ